ncbi:TolC family protein [Alistipes sp. ZOR0009]|uniref:TolC family protein n=1 Tax=Alistipes sp. ZOR0009 TaxID=1339253 RepID=UPI0006488A9A|nr:TolC family protein [Alistipes sp. ZOR0009]
MKQVTTLLALACLLVGKGAFSADNEAKKMQLSLKQAQEYAMENSLTVKDGLYDLDIAQKKIWESTAIGLPQAEAKLMYNHNPGSIPTIQFGNDLVPVGVKNSTNVTATVSQLIFSGSYIVGLQASKTYKEMVAQTLEKTRIDLRESVAQSYYLVLLMSETSAVLKDNLTNLQKTLFDTEKMLEKGFAESTSVDQLKIAVNDLLLSLSTTHNQEQVARRLLNYQLGLTLDSEIELTDKLENIALSFNRDRIIETPFDISKNINYNMAETQEKVKKLLYRLELTSYLPTVAGFYQFQKPLPAPPVNFQPVNMLGLSVTLPIFSSGERYSKVGQAKLALNKAQLAKEQATRGLNMEYLQSRDDFNTAWDKYLNSKSSLALAQKVLREVTIKFNNGLATSMDVTQANDKLLQSVGNLYSAEFDMLKAKLHLDKVTSNL